MKSVKIALAVSKKNTFKDSMILNMYIGLGQGQITPRGVLIVIKKFNYFNRTL